MVTILSHLALIQVEFPKAVGSSPCRHILVGGRETNAMANMH